MPKYITRVDRRKNIFRLNIPRKIVLEKGWDNVKYVTIEDHWGDRILIRRLMEDEELKTQD